MFYTNSEFIDEMVILIKECNDIVMKIYNNPNFDVLMKEDNTPLTDADKECNQHICSFLRLKNKIFEEITGKTFGIISEENKNLDYNERKNTHYSWLIDPVDGTKEFVKRNGQFTINIGLVEGEVPVYGIVSIPVSGEIYYGIKGVGSFKREIKGNINKLRIDRNKDISLNPKIVASSSHLNEDTKKFIEQFKEHELVSVGSSIKLLYIAENKADIYPRIALTSEWDTCAAHAVVKYAGGRVFIFDKDKLCNELTDEVKYNKEDLLNPFFVCF